MMLGSRRSVSAVCSALLLFQISGCSAASYVSQEALTAGVVGSAAGSGIGWLIGNEIGDKSQNIAVNAAIGGALGLIAGAIINERNVQIARQREVVMREARLMSRNQRELDALRESLYDSTSWGRAEVKPWDERYQINDSHRPYQGPTGYQRVR
ncbi:MAG: hypothetical protein KDD69_09830 [Bdellovibrionales bacterium]|nr:hypothetical protein [Bdellovibrionales bacterium]